MADKKLSSVSAVNDMNYVYAETSSGETVKISKADLASVVAGVVQGTVSDANNLNNGTYFYNKSGGSVNGPSEINVGIITQISAIGYGSGGNPIQQTFSGRHEGVFKSYARIKWADTWTDWERTDNFGYNSLAELNGGLIEQMNTSKNYPTLQRGEIQDANNATQTGIYQLPSNALNRPQGSNFSEGSLVLVTFDIGTKFQMAIRTVTNSVAYRSYDGSNWKSWSLM